MAVQGDVTYSIFTYQCDLIRWTSRYYYYKTIVGFIVNVTFIKEHPLSWNASVVDIDCSDDAVSGWTNVVYRIDNCKYLLLIAVIGVCILYCIHIIICIASMCFLLDTVDSL